MHRNKKRYMYAQVELQKRSVEEKDCDLTTEILLSHPNFKTLTTLGNRAFVALAP